MNMSGFRDEAIYKGKKVYFYKRAQILAVDLACALQCHPDFKETFSGQEHITMFPDYRVPQILREMGILEYSDTLEIFIDSKATMAFSSELEVEIRGATV